MFEQGYGVEEAEQKAKEMFSLYEITVDERPEMKKKNLLKNPNEKKIFTEIKLGIHEELEMQRKRHEKELEEENKEQARKLIEKDNELEEKDKAIEKQRYIIQLMKSGYKYEDAQLKVKECLKKQK